jgi:hypothetical protein
MFQWPNNNNKKQPYKITIKPLNPRLTNSHSKGNYAIQLFMAKLKLPHGSWIKGFDCSLFKDNMIITLLLKKKKNKKIVLCPNKSRMTN